MVPYGKRLVELRGTRSQAEVAKAIGIATSTLSMYELEQRVPRDNIKIALAKYYDTSVQRIFSTCTVDISFKGWKLWDALPNSCL